MFSSQETDKLLGICLSVGFCTISSRKNNRVCINVLCTILQCICVYVCIVRLYTIQVSARAFTGAQTHGHAQSVRTHQQRLIEASHSQVQGALAVGMGVRWWEAFRLVSLKVH